MSGETSNRGWNRGWKWRGRGRGGYRGRNNWYKNKNARPGNSSNPGPSTEDVSASELSSPFISNKNFSQTMIVDSFKVVKGPYRGWRLYFPLEEYKETSATAYKVIAVENFIKRNMMLYSLTEIEDRRSYSVDLKKLLADEEFMEHWPGFENDLNDMPEHSLNCLGIAMHQIIGKALDDEILGDVPDTERDAISPVEIPTIRARILNFEPIIPLKQLKTNYYGKLISVRGTIIRAGNIKLLCDWLAFACNTCKKVQVVRQPEGVHTQPNKCITGGCRGRHFTPQRSSSLTQTVNWQSVRLQEILGDDQREGGRVPRTIECELTEELVDSCAPGDVVTITGVVKVRCTTEHVKKNAPSMYLIYIEGVSIQNSKNNTVAGRTSGGGIEFNVKDYYAIQEIHAQPRLFRLLVASLCPAIYSHEMVKAGLLLGLFGGSATPVNNMAPSSSITSSVDTRSDPHILVVGDPGLGKSQMLQACASVAPRGVYVCGNTSTASGLTVTLTRESGSDYALEAGALVLADQGCCCIDEFDKMSSQHQALLEAMEQQCISIAKAGVLCTLPARTSILAAANPSGGHYNRSKTVSENLKLGSALLSRFDLVFILLDQPNEHLDSLLSEHIMALHSGIKQKKEFHKPVEEEQSQQDLDQPLSERLKVHNGDCLDVIPHQLLRKYIAYARKYVHPKVTPEAGEVLRSFYLKLRRQHQGPDCTPVTTRQLESLIRLTEARAKSELREEATAQDALEVVEIMRCSLVDTFADEFGSLDFKRSQNGSGMSSRNQVKKFVCALQKQAEMQSRSVFTIAEMKQIIKAYGIQVSDFFSFISSLNTQGFLLKKGSQLYQLLTVDY